MSPSKRILRAIGQIVWLLCGVASWGCASLTLPPPLMTDGLTEASFPDAGAVVLQDVATLEFRVMQAPGADSKRLVALLDHRRRLKVLRETGLAQADVRLPVDGYSTVTRVVARSVSPTGSQSYVANRNLQLLEREQADNRAPEVQDLGFHIPDGQVGGLLEYRYQRVYLDPELIPPWVFGATVPVMHAELGIVTAPEVKLDYRYGRGDTRIRRAPLQRTTEDGRERLVFIETDLPAYFAEPHMPHVGHCAPWLNVALRQTSLTEEPERVESWDDVGVQVIRDMVAVGGGPQNGNVRMRLESTRAALTPLQVPTLGVRRPQPASALLNGSPACSRDAAAVVLRALTGTKVQAGVMLLTGPEAPPVPEDFPARSAFSRAVISLTADKSMLANLRCTDAPYLRDPLCGVQPGSRIYFDPLCAWCPFGMLPAEFGGSRGLLIDGVGNTSWVDLPLDPPGRNSLYLQGSLTMDVDGSLSGDMTAEARGLVATRLRTTLGENHNDLTGQAAISLARALLGEAERPSTYLPSIDHYDNVDSPLTAKTGLKAQAATDKFNTFRIPPELLAGSSIPAFWRGTRSTAAVVQGPWWKETSIDVTLPPGFKTTLPPPVKLATPQAEYAAGFALHGMVLRYARRFILKQAIIAASDWPAFNDFFETVREAERTPMQMVIEP